MSGVVDVLLGNALVATALAVVVAPVARLARRPALEHALWVVVLARLFMPPLLTVPVLPAEALPAPVAAPEGAPTAVLLAVREAPLGLVAGREAEPWSVTDWAGGAWFLGAAVVLVIAVLRTRRFDAGLAARSSEAPPRLRERAEQLSAAMGLPRLPEVRLVHARVPPMLWHRPGCLTLLFPETLLARLDPGQCDALLAHELAHVRRRDHWVRYLELLASAVFWWHPVVWWARRALRRAEEQCCDAWVVRTLDEPPRVYARALIETLEFLAGGQVRTPALACAAGDAGPLKERLTMIMHRRIPRPFSRVHIAAGLLVAACALALVPARAERDEAVPENAAEPDLRASMIDLERQAAALEEELLEIRMRQQELEYALAERHGLEAVERARADAARQAAAGRADDARRTEAEALRLEQQIAADSLLRDLEREQVRRVREIEAPLRRTQIEIEAAEAAGNAELAEELRREALEREAMLAESNVDMLRARLELERAAEGRAAAEVAEKIALELERAGVASGSGVDQQIQDRIRELEERLRRLEPSGAR